MKKAVILVAMFAVLVTLIAPAAFAQDQVNPAAGGGTVARPACLVAVQRAEYRQCRLVFVGPHDPRICRGDLERAGAPDPADPGHAAWRHRLSRQQGTMTSDVIE